MTFRAYMLIATLAMLPVFQAALAQDEPLGRLFYTARQRAALDANIRSASERAKKPIPIPPSVTLNGVVTRSDGEQTVWIDGRAYHRSESGALQAITRPGEPGVVEIKVPGVANQRSMRVGQQLDPVTGETFEAFETPPPRTRHPNPAAGAGGRGAESALPEVEE